MKSDRAVDMEMSEVVERINALIDALEVSLRAEFREGLSENRRYTDVQFESVRDDIRMLAESFGAMSVELDSLQR
jgi:hypothetical protein